MLLQIQGQADEFSMGWSFLWSNPYFSSKVTVQVSAMEAAADSAPPNSTCLLIVVIVGR